MSRLYGRAFDVYQISNSLLEKQIPKYIEDNKKITMDELIDSTGVIEIYLPQKAIDFLVNYPIHIVKSAFIPRNMSSFPSQNNPNATIFFKGVNFKEDQKRDLVFFLGSVLSNLNPDELPKKDDIPCEYSDLLPLLLEYLYLRDNNEESIFLSKHLDSLKINAERYHRVYESHQKHLVNSKNYNFYSLDQNQINRINDYNKKCEDIFLKNTLTMLVPFSSIDGVLQIIDKYKNKEDIKAIINDLFENTDHNRQKLLYDRGIESYGYKRLRKEIDGWGSR